MCTEKPAPEVTFRPVSPQEDAEVLLAIFASTREEEIAVLGQSADASLVGEFLRSQLRAQKQSYDERYPSAVHELLVVEGEVAGQIWVNLGAEEIRLIDIALLPAYRGRGIGTQLLCQLQERARTAGVPLRHMVFKLNEGAKRFYARLGFVQTAEMGMYELMEWKGAEEGAQGV